MIYMWLLILLAGVYFFWKYPSLRKTWYWLPRRGMVALMYHHVSQPPGITDEQYPFTISPALFEEQLRYLAKNGYTPLNEQDLCRARNGEAVNVRKPVVLTFDDGYEDTYTHLFALLKKYRTPVIIFLITERIGTPGYLTWAQIEEMKSSGLVAFGSHTCSHRRLRSLPNAEIVKEITESKQIIEQHLKGPVFSFCYPFGAGGFDKRVRPQVLKAGYTLDFSTKKGINPWPWRGKKTILRAFPRGGETLFDFYLQLTRGRSKL